MRPFIILFIIIAITNTAIAQSTETNKSYFISAKQDIENMLNGNEQPNYEQAIYIIENAFYENTLDKESFDVAMQNHITYIRKIVKANYNFDTANSKPTLLISKEQIEQQYKKALTNYAIYQYMTLNIGFVNSQTILFHKKYNYSYADPMASNNWTYTQVTTLNNTDNGNCFALASLFKILSNRLNSEASLCTAPSHIYISHKDNLGIDYNVELGSKNFVGAGTLSTLTHSSPKSIQNNIALRHLTEKQSVALCLVYLAKGYEHKFNNTTDDFILQCAETAIKYDDKNLNALLLKAEFLENNLIAQQKTINSLQTQKGFQEYETLIVNLFNLGYREMPLQMKNQLIKGWSKDTITKLSKETYARSEANLRNQIQSKEASISWGLFDENFTDKQIERIGNTLFNTKTKKITSFAKDQNLYNNYNFDPVVFAWNIDPLAHEYPGISPFAFAANNPIMFTDHKGAYVEGSDGKKVTYKMLAGGKIQWSANATDDVKRVGEAMLKTKTGTKVFKQMQVAKYPIKIIIDEKSTDKMDRFAETDPTFTKDRKTLVKATITFYMKTINDFVDNPQKEEKMDAQSKQMKDNNFSVEDIIGVNGSHEGTHAADPLAVKDIADQYYFDKDVDPEARPEKNEDDDIKERIKQKETEKKKGN